MSETVVRSVRASAEWWASVVDTAKREDESVNTLIVRAVEEWLAGHRGLRPKPGAPAVSIVDETPEGFLNPGARSENAPRKVARRLTKSETRVVPADESAMNDHQRHWAGVENKRAPTCPVCDKRHFGVDHVK